jgi:RNA polymerase sigma-70 factor (ECF subfamily)
MNAATTPPDDDLQAPLRPDDDAWSAMGDPIDPIDRFDTDGDAGGHVAAATGTPGPAVAPAASEEQLVAWIEAIVNQDERALAALYDATFTRVFGLVQSIVRSAALSEEVVEDAYFQVWRQAVRFDPARGKALTWLLAMARSRAIDALRREARFAHDTLDDECHPEPSDSQPAHDDLLDLARNRADLHQALMLLGAQPRQLVSMSFFRGLSHEEIAEQMELPLGTVKSQIRRALLALREALGDPSARLLAS